MHEKKIFKRLAVYLVVVGVLFGIYNNIASKIPISYWDEMIWVGRSYFFDYYIKGDFNDRVWRSYQSYDQPKLAEYMYGAWLYPRYLSDKSKEKDLSFDYTKYLISRGYYMIDESFNGKYIEYYKQMMSQTVVVEETESGSRDYYYEKYGDRVLKTVDLVLYSRKINIVWLILTVIVVYKIFSFGISERLSLILAFGYGLNNLVTISTLKAHSEALFLLLFNSCLLMLLMFFKYRRLVYLILFSVLAGLCTATKLNGIMLLPIFLIANLIRNDKRNKWVKYIISGLIVLLISLSIFFFINPFLFPDPINNVKLLYGYRNMTANLQSIMFPEAYLGSPLVRFWAIFRNFFGNGLAMKFNGMYSISTMSSFYSIVIFVLFIAGILREIIKAFSGDKFRITIMAFFGLVMLFMCYYLVLDWERYYIQLVMFIYYYEFVGLIFFIKFFAGMIQRKRAEIFVQKIV